MLEDYFCPTWAAFAPHNVGKAGLCSPSPLPFLAACLSPKRFKSLCLSTWPSWSPSGICQQTNPKFPSCWLCWRGFHTLHQSKQVLMEKMSSSSSCHPLGFSHPILETPTSPSRLVLSPEQLSPKHPMGLTSLLGSAKLLCPCRGQILSALGFQSFSPVPTLFKGNKYRCFVQRREWRKTPGFWFYWYISM